MSSDNVDRLNEIAAREQAATPGPWLVRRHGKSRDADRVSNIVHVQEHIGWKHVVGIDGKTQFGADAEFIAHARDDVPWLMARVAELEAALNRESPSVQP